MQNEISTEETVHITEIAAWQFKVDGSVIPKTLPIDISLLKKPSGQSLNKKTVYIHGMVRAGFERFADFGRGRNSPGTIIFRKSESGEFAASIWETEMFYFENILALLEFFRRYGEFFRAESQNEIADSLSTIASALQEKRSTS